MGCRAADNIFLFFTSFAVYCGGGGGDGGETCQLVTAPGPELSSKLGIKCCDGQKIGWEFKEALSQRGGTADRLHAGPPPLPRSSPPPHPSSQVHGDAAPCTVHRLLQSDWPLVKASPSPPEPLGRRRWEDVCRGTLAGRTEEAAGAGRGLDELAVFRTQHSLERQAEPVGGTKHICT